MFRGGAAGERVEGLASDREFVTVAQRLVLQLAGMRAYTHSLDVQIPTSLVEACWDKERPSSRCRQRSRTVDTGNLNMVYGGCIT